VAPITKRFLQLTRDRIEYLYLYILIILSSSAHTALFRVHNSPAIPSFVFSPSAHFSFA
jgi:hypothetical protein